MIAAASGERATAIQLAERADELADLGGNIERALVRQQLYVAEQIGRIAETEPVRQPASDLLRELLNRKPNQ